MRTILVMAGGTGGHVFPALAVAAEMTAAGWKVVWLGAKNGMEATLVPKQGYTMEWIRFSGLRGKGIRGLDDAVEEQDHRPAWYAGAPDVTGGLPA